MKKKIITKENYYEFRKRKLKFLLSKPESYLYFSLAVIAFGIYWYETNLHEALEVVMLFCTSFTVVIFVIELLFTIINRKIEINNLMTEFCLMLIFIGLSVMLYDDLYLKALKLFIIYSSIPIITVSIINKI